MADRLTPEELAEVRAALELITETDLPPWAVSLFKLQYRLTRGMELMVSDYTSIQDQRDALVAACRPAKLYYDQVNETDLPWEEIGTAITWLIQERIRLLRAIIAKPEADSAEGGNE